MKRGKRIVRNKRETKKRNNNNFVSCNQEKENGIGEEENLLRKKPLKVIY